MGSAGGGKIVIPLTVGQVKVPPPSSIISISNHNLCEPISEQVEHQLDGQRFDSAGLIKRSYDQAFA